MKEISVKFVDFWAYFDVGNNFFVDALSTKFKVNIIYDETAEKPDILFYSGFGFDHYKYKDCVKIYYTGENDVPNFNECDYAISFYNIDFDGRNLRYPLYMEFGINDALNPPQLSDMDALNRGFCTMLMRNSYNCDKKRLEIIEAVNDYKAIAFGGPYRNNVGGSVGEDGKLEFIAKYKFNLALENTSLPGYITEKIVEPFAAPTVPIYWGASDVDKDFNPDSFINVNNYASLTSFIADLKEIDNDSERYLNILRAPRLNKDKEVNYKEELAKFLCNIADSKAIKRGMYGQQNVIYRRNHIMSKTMSQPKLLNLMGRLLGI